MSMWEPFSGPARRAVVRSQEVAQMFGAHFIGTEHMIFALAESDDAVGAALAKSVDREALRVLLGKASRAPTGEMVFTPGAKSAIELAFENARRLNHSFIGTAHLALGILGTKQPPPLVPGEDLEALRATLELAARDDLPGARTGNVWNRSVETEPNPVADAVDASLARLQHFGKPGTRISVTVAVPGEAERTWSWLRMKDKT